MSDFNYLKAADLQEAAAKQKSASQGAYLAGGMTLLPAIKLGLNQPSDLVDLAGLGDLQGVRQADGNMVIGAMTRHADVAGSGDVRAQIAALADLAGTIGDPMVRNKGTLGGSLANNDPGADYPAACLGLGATIITDAREISADDFFTGLLETALEDGEIITAVSFPVPDKAAYAKFAHPASRFALVGVFVAKGSAGVRIAITGAGQDGVFRMAEMETALTKNFSPDAISDGAVSADGLNADIHAAADYRAHLIGVMARRAVAACA